MKILVTIIFATTLWDSSTNRQLSTTKSAPMPAAACEKFAQKINDLYPFQYAYCIDAEEPAP